MCSGGGSARNCSPDKARATRRYGSCASSIEWAGKRPEEVGNAYANLAEIWRLGGDLDRAAEALERAIAMYEQKGIVPMAERMRSQLEELRSRP